VTTPDSRAAGAGQHHLGATANGKRSSLRLATSRAELSALLPRSRTAQNARVALVPTMGALHRGHAALLDEARNRSDLVVASIFVNPMQFGPAEDLAIYPRDLAADTALCRDHGVDVVFAPSVDALYPAWLPAVTVDPGELGGILEGVTRPGHFKGVLTVVAKLFGLIDPDVALFGEKDYQQLVLLQHLVKELCLPVEVVGVETVREPDGLALSSRNRYLSDAERVSASALSRALVAGQAAGPRGPRAVVAAAETVLAADPGVAVDYLTLRAADLSDAPSSGDARLLVAATVGTTRLIDNVAVSVG